MPMGTFSSRSTTEASYFPEGLRVFCRLLAAATLGNMNSPFFHLFSQTTREQQKSSRRRASSAKGSRNFAIRGYRRGFFLHAVAFYSVSGGAVPAQSVLLNLALLNTGLVGNEVMWRSL
jgi:hypothetical protein